jgi:hypothetical protein
MPDGRCEHRWANRLRRVVSCGFPAGRRAALSELEEAVGGLLARNDEDVPPDSGPAFMNRRIGENAAFLAVLNLIREKGAEQCRPDPREREEPLP